MTPKPILLDGYGQVDVLSKLSAKTIPSLKKSNLSVPNFLVLWVKLETYDVKEVEREIIGPN